LFNLLQAFSRLGAFTGRLCAHRHVECSSPFAARSQPHAAFGPGRRKHSKPKKLSFKKIIKFIKIPSAFVFEHQQSIVLVRHICNSSNESFHVTEILAINQAGLALKEAERLSRTSRRRTFPKMIQMGRQALHELLIQS
jgi:hypothetical protein